MRIAMFKFIEKLLGTKGTKTGESGAGSSSASAGIKTSHTVPVKHDAKMSRAVARKATRMKLERILERTAKH
jgi:hypothetical protein